MRVDWHGQSAFTLDGEAATVFIDPWGDMSAAAAHGIDLGLPGDRLARRDRPADRHPRARRPQRGRGDRRRADPGPLAGRDARVAGRQRGRDRLRARRRGGDRTRPEHDRRLRPRRDPRRPLRRLRPGGAATRAAGPPRRHRPALHPGRRRLHDRRRHRGEDRHSTWRRPGSCRCTTRRRRSASSRPRSRSSTRCRRPSASTRAPSTPPTSRRRRIVPAAPGDRPRRCL